MAAHRETAEAADSLRLAVAYTLLPTLDTEGRLLPQMRPSWNWDLAEEDMEAEDIRQGAPSREQLRQGRWTDFGFPADWRAH